MFNNLLKGTTIFLLNIIFLTLFGLGAFWVYQRFINPPQPIINITQPITQENAGKIIAEAAKQSETYLSESQKAEIEQKVKNAIGKAPDKVIPVPSFKTAEQLVKELTAKYRSDTTIVQGNAATATSINATFINAYPKHLLEGSYGFNGSVGATYYWRVNTGKLPLLNPKAMPFYVGAGAVVNMADASKSYITVKVMVPLN